MHRYIFAFDFSFEAILLQIFVGDFVDFNVYLAPLFSILTSGIKKESFRVSRFEFDIFRWSAKWLLQVCRHANVSADVSRCLAHMSCWVLKRFCKDFQNDWERSSHFYRTGSLTIFMELVFCSFFAARPDHYTWGNTKSSKWILALHKTLCKNIFFLTFYWVCDWFIFRYFQFFQSIYNHDFTLILHFNVISQFCTFFLIRGWVRVFHIKIEIDWVCYGCLLGFIAK